MRFQRIVWSPVEIQWLKDNLDKTLDQQSIALAKSRAALKRQLDLLAGKTVVDHNKISFQSKIGKRDDLGIWCRSGWEANCMRLFNLGLLGFKTPEYEPQTFSFTDHVPPKGAALSYTPDFRVQKGKKSFWVEVKGGWLRGQDKTKLRRFKKYYPKEFADLIAITPSPTSKTTLFFKELGVKTIFHYNELSKEYKNIVPYWEK